ncbi:GreA/GreB family elongation factor [Bradyrhizobium oligotrophicum]|uniref:GreA/GreB family elongation factor n=1 Tax=Bradyrhizobium oligotrophicum TaxID=44255 RepID=UPI003EC05212
MAIVFTPLGHAKFLDRISEQKLRVKQIGSELGEEAGINCDWHDNFGYEDARRRLDQESRRLAEMMNLAQAAIVREVVDQAEVVAVGSTVEFETGGQSKVITIGGYGETDPQAGLVSYDSPIARPIMAARVGEMIESIKAGEQIVIQITSILPPGARYFTVVRKLFGLSTNADLSNSSS